MSADNYFITDQNGIYFLTFTVIDWVDARLPAGRFLREKNTKLLLLIQRIIFPELQTQNN
jgi:hypothetical protein